jgi:hypothetical protein
MNFHHIAATSMISFAPESHIRYEAEANFLPDTIQA